MPPILPNLNKCKQSEPFKLKRFLKIKNFFFLKLKLKEFKKTKTVKDGKICL